MCPEGLANQVMRRLALVALALFALQWLENSDSEANLD